MNSALRKTKGSTFQYHPAMLLPSTADSVLNNISLSNTGKQSWWAEVSYISVIMPLFIPDFDSYGTPYYVVLLQVPTYI